MQFQANLPGCCSVGIMYGFGWNPNNHVPAIESTSGHFVAIFSRHQKPAYDLVCKKHTLLSVVKARGGHTKEEYLAICVFQRGQRK